MILVDLLSQTFASLVGARVQRAYIVLWPTESGNLDTDTKLKLEVSTMESERCLVLGTGSDEQTPLLVEGVADKSIPYGLVWERVAKWEQGVYNSSGFCEPETFDVALSEEFDGLIGSIINEVSFICFQDSLLPAGVSLALSTGRTIWSVSSGDGNRIFFDLPEGWFDEPMVLKRIGRIDR